MDTADTGKIQKVGDKNNDEIVPPEKQKEETWVEFQTRTSIMARKIWEQMKLPFLHEKKAECMCAPWSGPAMKKRML